MEISLKTKYLRKIVFTILTLQIVIVGSQDVKNNDPFIKSTEFGGKEFLLFWEKQTGNWLENYGLCQKYGAEMVTLHSNAENDHFLDFARNFGIVRNPGVWLGGRFVNKKSPYFWINKETNDYRNGVGGEGFVGGEPNEDGNTCLIAAYDNIEGDKNNAMSFRNHPCHYKDLYFACQRKIGGEQKGYGRKRSV